MAREDDTHWLAVRVPKLHTASRLSQALAQAKARNFAEWRAAAARLDLQTLNTTYADADGNIYYLYNGAIAKRDPSVDWTKPVDGADPRFEWNGFHTIDELPQVLNPPSGYVQNCNSSPFTTTDDGNPSPLDFPAYMAEDRFDDKRRAKMSRYLLRGARDLTFDDWQALAYDTTLYWPMTELPRYARLLDQLAASRPDLAAAARPYLDHLLGVGLPLLAHLDAGDARRRVVRGALRARLPGRDLEAGVRRGPRGAFRGAGARRPATRDALRLVEGAVRRRVSHAASRRAGRTPPRCRSTTRDPACRRPGCAARSARRSRSTTRRQSPTPRRQRRHASSTTAPPAPPTWR